MKLTPEIVVVGSLNMDIGIQVKRTPQWGETIFGENMLITPGGKGSNQAYAAAALGASVAMIGKVGEDLFGQQLEKNLEKVGVNTTCVQKVMNGSTGLALIHVNDHGENCITLSSGANLYVTPEYIRECEHVICNAKIILIQLEIPIDTVIEVANLAKKYEIPIMLDPSPAMELPDYLYRLIDYIVPNEIELSKISNIQVTDPRSARVASMELIKKGVKTVCSKLGGGGVVVTSPNRTFTLPAYQVPVVDTTAAGDGFAGALAVALVSGKDLWTAVQFANAFGALTVTRKGAQKSFPNLKEVTDLINLNTKL